MKDLNRLQEMAGEVHQYTSEGLGGLARVYSATRSLAEGPQLAHGQVIGSTSEYPRGEVIAAGGSVEFKGFAGETGESVTELPIAPRTDRDSRIAGFRGVKYLTPEIITTGKGLSCEAGEKQQEKSAEKEFEWNALAQAPTRIAFLRGGARKTGDIDVALARGRARIKINKLPANSSGVQWPSVNEFKTFNEIISLRLLPAHNDAVEADKVIDESADEVSLPLLEKVKRGVINEETDNAHK